MDDLLSCNDKQDDTGCHEQDDANQNTQSVSSKVLKEKQLNKKSMPGRIGVYVSVCCEWVLGRSVLCCCSPLLLNYVDVAIMYNFAQMTLVIVMTKLVAVLFSKKKRLCPSLMQCNQ